MINDKFKQPCYNRNMKNHESFGNNSGQNNNSENGNFHIGVTKLGNIDVFYDEQLKKAADSFLNEEIMPISNTSIDELVKYSAHLSYDEETIRNELYSSNYDIRDLASVENQTQSILSKYENIETFNQGKSYEWVEANGGCRQCESRFYIAPKKDNIHKVIRKLAQLSPRMVQKPLLSIN